MNMTKVFFDELISRIEKYLKVHACFTMSWQPSSELPGVAVKETPSSLNERD